MAVGCNIGDDHGMFEPIHGSAPTHAPDEANPIAMIQATSEGLRWLGKKKNDSSLIASGDAIEAAVSKVLRERVTLTYDLIGNEKAAKMSEVTTAILEAM